MKANLLTRLSQILHQLSSTDDKFPPGYSWYFKQLCWVRVVPLLKDFASVFEEAECGDVRRESTRVADGWDVVELRA